MLNKIISLGDPCVGDSLAGYIPGLVSTILSRAHNNTECYKTHKE